MMRFFLALCVFASLARAEDIFAWYPLQVGNQWIYDWESRNGNQRDPDISRWTTIVTVKQHIKTAEGVVIVRELALQGEVNAGWIDRRFGSAYLVRNDCLYPLYELWDAQKQAFTPKFRGSIEDISPDFCFPLEIGARWKGGSDWPWVIEGIGPVQGGPALAKFSSAIRLVQQWTSGPLYVWFQKGVGVVSQWSWHNGTYTESTGALVRFVPSAQAPR